MRKFITDILAKTNLGVEQNAYVLGTVGIGTTSPIYQFDITTANYKSFRIQSSDDALITIGSTVASSQFYSIGASGIGSGQGSNLFWIGRSTNNPSGLLTKDFVINSSGNVGIGITNPSYKLDVAGDIRAGGADPLLILQPDSGTYVFFQKLSTSNGDYLRLYDGTNYSMFWKNTNVGIGTTSPGYKLQVYNSSNGTTAAFGGTAYGVRIDNGGTFSSGRSTIYGVDNTFYGSYQPLCIGASTLAFSISGTDKVTIDTSGNVGIGTTSPAYKLDVIGTQKIGSTAISQGLLNIVSTTTGTSDIFFSDDTDNRGVVRYDHTSDFMSLWSAGSERMRITSTGNVGIGTTSPTSYSGFTTLNINNATNGGVIDLLNNGSRVGTFFNTSTYVALGSIANVPLYFYANNSEAMRITSDGNVGIGTTSPNAKLVSSRDVTSNDFNNLGAVQLKLIGSTYTNKQLLLGFETDNDYGLIQTLNDGASWSSYNLAIQPKGGNVGIGTTSPTLGLHIADGKGLLVGPSGASGSMYVSPSDENTINGSYGIASDTADIWLNYRGYQDGFSYFRDTRIGNGKGTAILMVDGSEGNVGIGTTSPSAKLDVNGAQIIQSAAGFGTDGDQAALFLSNTANFGLSGNFSGYSRNLIKSDGGSILTVGRWNTSLIGELSIESGSSGLIKFLAGASERMRITSGGQFWFKGVSTSTGYEGAITNTETTFDIYGSRYGGTGKALTLWATGASESMRINYTNNILIGTTVDSGYKLDVNGTGRFVGTLRSNDHEIKNSANSETLDLFLSPSVFNAYIDYPTSRSLNFRNKSTGVSLTLASTGEATFSSSVTATATIVTASEGREVQTYMPSSYTTDDLVSGHEYGWYSDHWRLGMTRSGGAAGADFVIQWNGARRLSLSSGGNLTATGNIYSSKTSGEATVSASLSGNEVYMFNNSSSYGLYSTDYGSLFVRTKSTGLLNIYDKIYATSGGNVGIGTTSPTRKLHVLSTDDTRGILVEQNSSSSYAEVHFKANREYRIGTGGSTSAAEAANNWYVYDATAATQRFVINSSGNVGIGTTSPANKLDVSGVTSTQGLYIPGLYTFGQASSGIEMQLTSASYNAIRFFQGSDWTGVIHSFGRSWAGGVSVGMVNIEGYNGVTIGAWNIPTATFLSSGNVGIGTTSPNAKLTVLAASTGYSSDSQIKISDSTTSYYGGLSFDDAGATRLSIRNSYDGTGSIIGFGFGSSADKVQIIDGTGLIVNEGNVGIGTTSPLSPLHQVGGGGNYTGEARFGGSSTAFGIELKYTQAGSTLGSIYTSPTYSSTDILFKLGAGSGNENQLVLKGNGNVGIGTTSPTELVEAYKSFNGDVVCQISNPNAGTSAAAQFFVSNGTNRTQFFHTGTSYTGPGVLTSAAGLGGLYNATVQGLAFLAANASGTIKFATGTGNDERMRITSGGNVGIGTASTVVNSLLNVAGGINTTTGIIGYDTSDAFTFNGKTQPHYGFNLNPTGSSPMGISGYYGIALATQGSERMRILQNGNVGIGTASPSALLHVSQPSADTVLRIGNNSNYDQYIYFNGGNDWSMGMDYSNSNAFVLSNYSTLGTNDRLVVTTSGNVGIGTISPGAKLDILSTAGNQLRISYNSSYYWNIAREAADGRLSFTDSNNGEKLTILPGGNVGIGTTSPQTFLTLNGANVSYAGQLQVASNDYAQITFYNSAALTPGASNRKASLIYNVGGNTFEIANQITNGHLILQGSDSGGGRVGIGTDSPALKLDVVSGTTSYPVLRLQNTDANGYSGAHLYSSAGILTGHFGWANGSSNTLSDKMYFGTIANKPVVFTTNDSEKVRIGADGNVGIGTANPLARLNIWTPSATGQQVGLRLNNPFGFDNLNTGAKIVFSQDRSTSEDIPMGELGVGQGDAASSVNGYMYFSTKGSNTMGERMRITSSGNVGIGTTSPREKLDVDGNVVTTWGNDRFIGLQFQNGGDYRNGLLLHGDNRSTGILSKAGSGSNPYIWFGGGIGTTSEWMRITSAGNVGIGTTSPSEKLHIVGSTAVQIIQSTTAGLNSTLKFTTTARTWGIGANMALSNSNLEIYDYTASANRLTIDSSGNVGIGTTSPGYKLEVNGGSVGNNIARFTTGGGSGGTRGLYVYSNDSYVKLQVNDNAGSVGSWAFMSLNPEGGNVGIGITNPGHKLHVVGAVGIGQNTNGTATIDAYGGKAYYGCDGTQITVAGNTGNVGIGTTSPGYKLEVAGTSYFSGLAHFGQTASSGSAFRWGAFGTAVSSDTMLCHNQLWNGSGWTILDSSVGTGYMNLGAQLASPNIEFGTGAANTAASTKMIILNNGNVGIGTTSPDTKLEVNGQASFGDNSTLAINGDAFVTVRAAAFAGIDVTSLRTSGNIGGLRGIDLYGTLKGQLLLKVNGDFEYVSGSSILYITSAGNVGIGTTTPSYNLHVEGNVSGISIYASHDIAAFSDITVKKEVKKIENAIEKVKELNGYTYVRTDDETGTRRAGVIAQEVQKVLPEVVSANPDGTLNVAYSNMIALLIEAVKEQQNEIDELKKLLKK
jgi:hypothetical protein